MNKWRLRGIQVSGCNRDWKCQEAFCQHKNSSVISVLSANQIFHFWHKENVSPNHVIAVWNNFEFLEALCNFCRFHVSSITVISKRQLCQKSSGFLASHPGNVGHNFDSTVFCGFYFRSYWLRCLIVFRDNNWNDICYTLCFTKYVAFNLWLRHLRLLVFGCYFKALSHHAGSCDSGFYRPQTKLREGNVFTGVCLSTGGGVR